MAGHTHCDESLEDYLEAVNRLEREGGVTRITVVPEATAKLQTA